MRSSSGRRIRVLHFMWRVGPGGGVSVVQRLLLKGTNKERFELHALNVRPFFPEDRVDEISDGVTFHPLNLRGTVGVRGQMRIMQELVRLGRVIRPDIFHAYPGYAWLAIPPSFISRGIKGRVLDIQADPYSTAHSRLNMLTQRFMVRQMGYHPVVHSRSTLDHIAEAYAIDPDSITLLPNGIDTASLAQPAAPRQEWRRLNGVPQDALVVLTVARLIVPKNIGLFVEVARRVLGEMDQAVFLITGVGPLRDSLESSVRNEGLQEKIRFLGYREDLTEIYHASDVFLLTSDEESFPLTVLEAMATGRPVVATSAGGVVEQVLDGRTGYLCPVKDAGALTRATLELLRDPARRSRFGEAGQARARQLYDTHEVVRQYEELYVRMVNSAVS